MLQDQNDNRDRDIRSNYREDLTVHFGCASVLEASRHATEDLELCHLQVVLRIVEPFYVLVGEPADQDVQQNNESHA
jgi:hypothetical protein